LFWPAGNEYFIDMLMQQVMNILILRLAMIIQQGFINTHAGTLASGEDEAFYSGRIC
jgi:hypothetical protein